MPAACISLWIREQSIVGSKKECVPAIEFLPSLLGYVYLPKLESKKVFSGPSVSSFLSVAFVSFGASLLIAGLRKISAYICETFH